MEPIRILQENVIMDPGGIESLLMNLYTGVQTCALPICYTGLTKERMMMKSKKWVEKSI